jgi:hypothetical protein
MPAVLNWFIRPALKALYGAAVSRSAAGESVHGGAAGRGQPGDNCMTGCSFRPPLSTAPRTPAEPS